MKSLIIAGAGGHALEIAGELLQQGHEKASLIFWDIQPGPAHFHGIQVTHDLSLLPDVSVILGTGNPAPRRRTFEALFHVNRKPASHLSARAIIHSLSVTLGEGLNLMDFCSISPHVVLGNGVLVNRHASIHHDAVVGDFSVIAPGARILGQVTIGADVFVGANAVVLPGLTVGDGAVIGAGAVVTQSIPPGETWVGVPGKRK